MAEELENENDYLEMCEHFKTVVADKDKSIKLMLLVNHELKKEILTSFGIIRLLDRELNAIENVPCNIKHLVSDLRSNLSEIYDSFFPLPNING
jgi:hypothetical protein